MDKRKVGMTFGLAAAVAIGTFVAPNMSTSADELKENLSAKRVIEEFKTQANIISANTYKKQAGGHIKTPLESSAHTNNQGTVNPARRSVPLLNNQNLKTFLSKHNNPNTSKSYQNKGVAEKFEIEIESISEQKGNHHSYLRSLMGSSEEADSDVENKRTADFAVIEEKGIATNSGNNQMSLVTKPNGEENHLRTQTNDALGNPDAKTNDQQNNNPITSIAGQKTDKFIPINEKNIDNVASDISQSNDLAGQNVGQSSKDPTTGTEANTNSQEPIVDQNKNSQEPIVDQSKNSQEPIVDQNKNSQEPTKEANTFSENKPSNYTTAEKKESVTQTETVTFGSFINKIKDGAVNAWETFKVLPSITIAQAMLESASGTSELAKYANALFGIKATSDWEGDTYDIMTTEYINGKNVTVSATFRAYDSWADSLLDHGEFLNKVRSDGTQRYEKVLGESDYKVAAQELSNAGYATDPSYASKLINIIENNKLYTLDVNPGLSIEDNRSVETPVPEIDKSNEAPAAEADKSNKAPAAETDKSNVAPAVETDKSNTVLAVEANNEIQAPVVEENSGATPIVEERTERTGKYWKDRSPSVSEPQVTQSPETGPVYSATSQEKPVVTETQVEQTTVYEEPKTQATSSSAPDLSNLEGTVFKATAYDPSVGLWTASDTMVRPGVVAVDPNVIPLGTELYIASTDEWPDYGYAIAEDTGGDIKGNWVDLWYPDYETTVEFGIRQVVVYVLE